MNKLVFSAILAFLTVFPVLSQAVQTDGGYDGVLPTYGANVNPSWRNNFFVAGQLGQTQYRDSFLGGQGQIGQFLRDKGQSDKSSMFVNVRLGWRWNGIIGPEIGYAYLGDPKSSVNISDGFGNHLSSFFSQNFRALTLGLNGKYNVYKGLFITAHGGYLYSQMQTKARLSTNVPAPLSTLGGEGTTYNGGWYAGLGVGYDLTKNFSIGLNYDNYSLKNSRISISDSKPARLANLNMATYSASAEYRF